MSDAAHNTSTDVTIDPSLVEELERHGVHGLHVGDRVRLRFELLHGEGVDEQSPAFFASFDGPEDLAERSQETLRSEFPQS
jgi:hypothetical protein